jgi:hypothetical protein
MSQTQFKGKRLCAVEAGVQVDDDITELVIDATSSVPSVGQIAFIQFVGLYTENEDEEPVLRPRYLSVIAENAMIAVSVIEQVDDADYAYTYNCYVLGVDGTPTSETKQVRNTSFAELSAGSVAMAWKAEDGTYWMKQTAEDEAEAATSSVVDFITDGFDRDDADTLGLYWSGSGFAIRDGVAYQTGAGDSYSVACNYATQDIYYPNGTPYGRQGNKASIAHATAPHSGDTGNNVYRYTSRLSTADYRAKVWVTIPDYVPVSRAVGVLFRLKQDRTAYTSVWNAVLVRSLEGNDRYAALAYDANYTTRDDGFIHGSYGPPYGALDYYASIPYGDNDFYLMHMPDNGSGPGTYLFEISQIGTLLTVSYGGNVLYQGDDLQAADAGFVGLLTGAGSQLGPSGPNDDAVGLEKIKVWSADIPEPPDDESGHGTYDADSGEFTYTDKYHAGETYNPNA